MVLSRFVKTYNSLPIPERDLPCCVYKDQAISWNLAYKYIKEKTLEGEEIQKILENLKLI